MSTQWGYKVHLFDETGTKSFLEGVLRVDQSVPFIGTGFTAGERARKGIVPFGGEWMQIMRDQIKASHVLEKPSDKELESFDFQALSDVYFREDIVDLDTIKDTINNLFTSVSLSIPSKLEFLDIPWSYIYTLNIDDAIERHINGVRVLPYQPFSRYEGRRYVYKLHGDADDVLTAPTKEGLRVIFGKGDYIRSLDRNRSLIADLVNDFQEKNVIFIGCSLTDEIDISYALAKLEQDNKPKKAARVYITGSAPTDYNTKKKLKDYGITDVVVVGNYSAFYSFAADFARKQTIINSPLDAYTFKASPVPYSINDQIRYLAQIDWRHREDPYNLSIDRQCQRSINALLSRPIAIIWGKRFSGRSTVLFRLLNENRTRRAFFIPSTTSVSDTVYSEFFRVQNALIAIDTEALHHSQMRTLASKSHVLEKNNTTIVLTTNRIETNIFGQDGASDAVEVPSKLAASEVGEINKILDPLGFQRWWPSTSILENVFSIANSPVVIGKFGGNSSLASRLERACKNWQADKSGKLEFAGIYYLTVRQKLYSRIFRVIANSYDSSYLGEQYMEEYGKKWAPFIEWEGTDAATRQSENSNRVLVCNSFSWCRLAVRSLSEKIGVDESAKIIVRLFSVLREVDNDPFELVLFDNLNSIYETPLNHSADWRSAIIKSVYEQLATVMSDKPDYWLQRAKSFYYMSNDEGELRTAIGYCEKGLVEKIAKTWSNAKLTKANIYGKLCFVSKYRNDEDLIKAVEAYVDAINDRDSNRGYIDELLRKSKDGRSYMGKVCDAASSRIGLLPHRMAIQHILDYLSTTR